MHSGQSTHNEHQVLQYQPAPQSRNRNLPLLSSIGCWFRKRENATHIGELVDERYASCLNGALTSTGTEPQAIFAGLAADIVNPEYRDLNERRGDILDARIQRTVINGVESLRETVATQSLGIEFLSANLSDLHTRLDPSADLPEFSPLDIHENLENDLLREESASQILRNLSRLRLQILWPTLFAVGAITLEVLLCWMTLVEVLGGASHYSDSLLLAFALLIGISLPFLASRVRLSKSLLGKLVSLLGLLILVASLSFLRMGILTYSSDGPSSMGLDVIALTTLVSISALVIAFIGDSAIDHMKNALDAFQKHRFENQLSISEARVDLRLSETQDRQHQLNRKLQDEHHRKMARWLPKEIAKVEDELARRHALVRRTLRMEVERGRKSLNSEIKCAAAQLARWHYEDLETTS